MWRKTLEYLGLQEEPDEYAEVSQRFSTATDDRSPQMHDTTGPIPVVRVPDDEVRHDEGRHHEAEQFERPTDPDLTQPVKVVDRHGGRESAAAGATNHRAAVREPTRARGAGGRRRQPDNERPTPRTDRRPDNVRQLRPVDGGDTDVAAGPGRRVAIVAVADYESGAREVGQRLRKRVPVVFDLTDAPGEDRRRVLDFVAGVTFALQGEMLKVGPRAFLVVPDGGEVPETEWARLANLGYRA